MLCGLMLNALVTSLLGSQESFRVGGDLRRYCRRSQQQDPSTDSTLLRVPYLRSHGNRTLSYPGATSRTGIHPQILLRRPKRRAKSAACANVRRRLRAEDVLVDRWIQGNAHPHKNSRFRIWPSVIIGETAGHHDFSCPFMFRGSTAFFCLRRCPGFEIHGQPRFCTIS